MTDPTSLSPASFWYKSTTDRISFNEGSPEIIRIDQRGFHYKGQFIEDAGEAYRLLVEFLRKHQPDQQWGAEHNDTPLSSAPVPVLVAERPWEREGWCDGQDRCWWGRQETYDWYTDWTLATYQEIQDSCDYSFMTDCLPAHALPIPEVNND